MSDTWMLDVLADLRAFAHRNGMPRLAERLVDTSRLAEEELAQREGKGTVRADDAQAPVGDSARRAARG